MRRALLGGLMLALAFAVGCGGGVAPIPVPPVPPVPPTPKIPAGFVVIEDTAAATQARGAFLASPKISAFLKNSGLRDSLLSVESQGPDGKPIGGRAGELIRAARATGALPRLYVLADDGSILQERAAPLDPDEFVAVFAAPHPRAFGNLPEQQPLLGAPVFGDTPNTKLIPRDQWAPVSLAAYLPPVYDQDGRGQCNASAACTAIEACREIAGLPPVKLSAGDLYSRINGGRDQGSTLGSGMEALLKDGVATAESVRYVWDGRVHNSPQVRAERRQFRLVEVYRCPTFDHAASALQQGFLTVCGISWHNNFNPDRDGWLPERGTGQGGGHALANYGLERRTRADGRVQWGLGTRNSWGVGWGHGGDCVIPEAHFRADWGMYAVRSVVRETDVLTPTPRPAARQLQLSLAEGLTIAP